MRTPFSVLAALTVTASLAAQGEQALPSQSDLVIRTGADLVRVDMYPTRDGQLVTDLRPEEVEVLEDGVRQRVEAFEFVNVQREARSTVPDNERARVFILFVDTHTVALPTQPELRRSLLRFLDRLLLPTDLIGVMTPEMSPLDVVLGDRATIISDLANDTRWLGRTTGTPDPKEFAWENCYGNRDSRLSEMKRRYRARSTIETLTDMAGWLGGVREERKAVLLVTSGWYFPEYSPERMRRDDERMGGNEGETCARDRRTLGRVNFERLVRDLGRAANRSNVSFYPVTPRGVTFGPVGRQSNRRRDGTEDQLERLAEMTDGLVDLKSRDFESVMHRMIDDTSSYYLLGYQSTNGRQDSSYREITVRVTRPGVKVRARAGYGGERYRAPSLLPALPKLVVDSRVTTAIAELDRFDTGAPVWLRTAAWTAPGEGQGGAFRVTGEVAGRDGSRWNGASAEVVVTGPGNQELFARTLTLETDAPTFDVRVPADGHVPFGDYGVRVRLRAARDVEVTSQAARVQVTDQSGGLGQPVYWRRGVFVRDEYRPTADPRFRRTERLRLELPTGVGDAVSARMLDRHGQPLDLDVPLTAHVATDGGRWVRAELPIVGLAPGDYVVEFTQRGAAHMAAFRIVP